MDVEIQQHVVFTREALFQMLGKVALPPWSDQHGGYLGGDLNCAVIADELQEAVEEYRSKAHEHPPFLGCATTGELIAELAARAETGSIDADYRTVGSFTGVS